MVHKGAKWTMGLGGVALLISMIFLVYGLVGIAGMESEEHWTGTAPTTADLPLSDMDYYQIFVEDSSTEVKFASSEIEFIGCEMDDATDFCGTTSSSGATYIGDLNVYTDGNYTIEFTGSGAVEIWIVAVDPEDIFAFGFGTCTCCLGGILLLIGAILSFTLKNNNTQSNLVLVDPNTGQLVSQQPTQNSDGSPGAVVIHQPPQYTDDPAMHHYNELLAQGYDPSKAESYARLRFPDFKAP
ncbi:MAG: hypothetical protein QF440_05870 [Candidatus Thalassarchaeaceae archaeon]|jgi:hypothetical protein|nr:hypothetical protein [Candidatus Thalassarchaeaceae archaeon]